MVSSTELFHTLCVYGAVHASLLFFRISRCAKHTVCIHISSTVKAWFIQCVQYIHLSRISGYVEFTDHQFCCIQGIRCTTSAFPSLALGQRMPAEPVHFTVKYALQATYPRNTKAGEHTKNF